LLLRSLCPRLSSSSPFLRTPKELDSLRAPSRHRLHLGDRLGPFSLLLPRCRQHCLLLRLFRGRLPCRLLQPRLLRCLPVFFSTCDRLHLYGCRRLLCCPFCLLALPLRRLFQPRLLRCLPVFFSTCERLHLYGCLRLCCLLFAQILHMCLGAHRTCHRLHLCGCRCLLLLLRSLCPRLSSSSPFLRTPKELDSLRAPSRHRLHLGDRLGPFSLLLPRCRQHCLLLRLFRGRLPCRLLQPRLLRCLPVFFSTCDRLHLYGCRRLLNRLRLFIRLRLRLFIRLRLFCYHSLILFLHRDFPAFVPTCHRLQLDGCLLPLLFY